MAVKLETLAGVIGLAERHANIFASVGVHPDNADCDEPTPPACGSSAAHPKVVAIGETGLDYYWHKDAPEWQRDRFRTHIRASKACGQAADHPHPRLAADTLRLMREESAGEAGGVMHCFTETREVAEQALDLGFYISFSGIVSFKTAESLRDVARFVPADRLLVETDAPLPGAGSVPRQDQPASLCPPCGRSRRDRPRRDRSRRWLMPPRATSSSFFKHARPS